MNTAVSEKPLRIKASVRKDAMLSVVSLLLLVVLLFPLYWIVATSLKTEQEIFRVPTTLWPEVIKPLPTRPSWRWVTLICFAHLVTA